MTSRRPKGFQSAYTYRSLSPIKKGKNKRKNRKVVNFVGVVKRNNKKDEKGRRKVH